MPKPRKAIARSTKPIARSPLKRTRKRIEPMSAGRRAGIEDRRDVRMALFARDHDCRLRMMEAVAGPCRGPLTPHHLRKASAGGAYDLANLVALCSGHNGWVEDHPIDATALGLVIR